MNWSSLAAVAALVGTGCAVSYVALRRSFRTALSEREQATERQLSALAAKVKALEARVAELSPAPVPQPVAALEIQAQAVPPVVIDAVSAEIEQVAPEIMTVLAAAAYAFLGRKVRILSARLLESPNLEVNPWSQQGRAMVQASHNLRS